MQNTFHSEPTEHNNPYHRNPYKQVAPPPPRKLHWLHIILVTSLIWLLIDIIAGSIVMSYVIPSRVMQVTATPEVVKMYIPVQGMPPYNVGMSSGNSLLFIKSFSEALSYNDANVIDDHTDTPTFRKNINSDPNKASFKEVCHHPLTGSCNNNLDTFNNQLMQDTMEFGIDPYSSMTTKAPYPDLSTYSHYDDIPTEYITGGYDNRGFTIPMQHYGTAVFSFSLCCGGSGNGYILESIDLY